MNNFTKKTFLLICIIALIALFSGCSKEDNDKKPSDSAKETTNNNTTVDTTNLKGGPTDSTLPVMVIESDTNYNHVTREYSNATFSISGTSYDNIESSYTGAMELKLRGNSTTERPKKPFKVKFDQKLNLFGMGENKHWVLLANDIDHTHLRNKLLNDFSGDMGDDVYMESTFIDVYYNNEYVGIYQLCEHIRVGKTRINIADIDDVVEDISKAITQEKGENKEFKNGLETALQQDYTWLDEPHSFKYNNVSYQVPDSIDIPKTTGGFVLEMDFYSMDDDSVASILTPYRQPFYFNTPEPSEPNAFKNTSLYKYASSYITSFEYALHSDDFFFNNDYVHYNVAHRNRFDWHNGWNSAQYDIVTYTDDENNGKHYSELFDMNSLVNNFIFCEYAMNWDSMKNSFHLYKDIDEIAYFGPQWDFDWAWGNKNMYSIDTFVTDQWHTGNIYFSNEQYYQSVQWNTQLIRDPYFLVRAYEKYKEIRPTLIEDMNKNIDSYVTYLSNSAAANDARWEQTYHQYRGEDFETSISSMKNFIDLRVTWLDTQFADIDKLVQSLNCYKKSDKITIDPISSDEVIVSISDDTVRNVTFQFNGIHHYDVAVTNGKASIKIPSKALTNDNKLNVVEVKAKDANNNYIYDLTNSKKGIYNLTISSFATF